MGLLGRVLSAIHPKKLFPLLNHYFGAAVKSKRIFLLFTQKFSVIDIIYIIYIKYINNLYIYT